MTKTCSFEDYPLSAQSTVSKEGQQTNEVILKARLHHMIVIPACAMSVRSLHRGFIMNVAFPLRLLKCSIRHYIDSRAASFLKCPYLHNLVPGLGNSPATTRSNTRGLLVTHLVIKMPAMRT